jgi:hypothetical protein
MNLETLKTLYLCSFFVFLFGALGFIVAINLDALMLYIEAPTSDIYETLIQTELFSINSISIYLLISVSFPGLGLIIYWLKNPHST